VLVGNGATDPQVRVELHLTGRGEAPEPIHHAGEDRPHLTPRRHTTLAPVAFAPADEPRDVQTVTGCPCDAIEHLRALGGAALVRLEGTLGHAHHERHRVRELVHRHRLRRRTLAGAHEDEVLSLTRQDEAGPRRPRGDDSVASALDARELRLGLLGREPERDEAAGCRARGQGLAHEAQCLGQLDPRWPRSAHRDEASRPLARFPARRARARV
jgi:hypothetical protein